jgi:peptidyl-prolyl cis-trans isomerase C
VKPRIGKVVRTWSRRLRERFGSPASGVRVHGVAAALLVLVAGGSGTDLVLRQLDQLPDGAVFRNAGETVSEDQLNQRIKLMELLYGLQRPPDPQGQDDFRRSVAKAVAVSGIVDDAAREKGIVIADRAASDQLEKLVKDSPWGDRSTFLGELGRRGLNEGQVLDEIKRQESSARLYGEVTGAVKAATDQDAQAFFDQHRTEMVSPEQRDISNIVVSTEDDARRVAEQARAGADFAALAKQSSIDGSTKDKGGSMGMVSADQLDPGYAKSAFGAPEGSVFGPVRTAQGWNVGRVGKLQQAVALPFQQVQAAIKGKLDNDAKLKVWNDFLAGRIRAADIVYAPAYRPSDPDAPPNS